MHSVRFRRVLPAVLSAGVVVLGLQAPVASAQQRGGRGFAAPLTSSQRGRLQADPAVDFVARDRAVHADDAQASAGDEVPGWRREPGHRDRRRAGSVRCRSDRAPAPRSRQQAREPPRAWDRRAGALALRRADDRVLLRLRRTRRGARGSVSCTWPSKEREWPTAAPSGWRICQASVCHARLEGGLPSDYDPGVQGRAVEETKKRTLMWSRTVVRARNHFR